MQCDMKKKILILLTLLLLFCITVQAQILNPVKWSYASKRISATEAILYLKAVIGNSWHIYSVNQQEGGPLKTSFTFETSTGFQLVGRVVEPKTLSKFEDAFGMMVFFFEKEVVFQQKIKLKEKSHIIKGKIEYMACTDEQCTPPLKVEFSIPVINN